MRRQNRREFLAWGAAACGLLGAVRVFGAQRGLEQFTVPAPPCKEEDLTPAVAPSAAFRANAPARTSLVEPGMAGKRMALAGYVIGLKCGRVKDVCLDFWQADAGGAYDARGFRLRGHQLTDAEGRYRLDTIVPGPSGGARHINVRILPPGRPALVTRLYFPDDPATGKDKVFAPKLAMKPGAGPEAYTFDIVLDM